MMAFTPYVALTAVLPLAVAAAVRNWAAAIVGTLVAVLLAGAVLPRAFGGPTEAEGVAGPALRVLAANMKLGEGDAATLVALVREHDVDVLSVEELTPNLADRLDAAGLARLLPHRELAAGKSSHGSGLYSRFDLGPGSTGRLSGGFPLITERLAIPGSAPVEASAVHTAPPTVSTSSWAIDLGGLPATGGGGPLRILLGDFNATLDQPTMRDLLDDGYVDAADADGRAWVSTWRSQFALSLTIDHVLIDHTVAADQVTVHSVDGSDHRALAARLRLPAAPDE
jgi:endonuclease/exonuclease/phosphatase (EEP) superfamily protein YafD